MHKIKEYSQSKIDTLLLLLQRGLPLVESPFAEIGEQAGFTESEVIELLTQWFADGTARRLGAIFDSRKMGYTSMLCCAHIEPTQFDLVTEAIHNDTGITHSYLRGWSDSLSADLSGAPQQLAFPNYWFTYMADQSTFEQSLENLADVINPATIVELPAIKRFKIDVIFDPRKEKGNLFDTKKREVKSATVSTPDFSTQEKEIVRILQGNIELTPKPFNPVAKAVGIDVSELFMTLHNWKQKGIIRRLPLILRHHSLGFSANGMCLWNVHEDDIEYLGQKLASCREITHCYQRHSFDGFEYNLYAMIHGTSWQETYDLFEKIQKEVGLTNGKMLCSLKEFKKSSPVYF